MSACETVNIYYFKYVQAIKKFIFSSQVEPTWKMGKMGVRVPSHMYNSCTFLMYLWDVNNRNICVPTFRNLTNRDGRGERMGRVRAGGGKVGCWVGGWA